MKHAIVKPDVAHLILPDEVQELPGLDVAPSRPRRGRVAAAAIAPPEEELARAIELLAGAQRPVVVCGNGARAFGAEIIELAEHLDAPIITTFKAKGLVPDEHPLACGVLGRSGIPVASIHMGRSDCLLVLGASFSEHTGIATYVPTIQVDFDRMMLGKFLSQVVPEDAVIAVDVGHNTYSFGRYFETRRGQQVIGKRRPSAGAAASGPGQGAPPGRGRDGAGLGMLLIRRRRPLVCRQAVELMSDYLEGALPARQRARLEEHLEGCPHCSEYLAQIRVPTRPAGPRRAGRPVRGGARRTGGPVPPVAVRVGLPRGA